MKKAAILAVLSGALIIGAASYTVLKVPPAPSGLTQPVPLQAEGSSGSSASSAATAIVFDIEPGDATARFVIEEVLRGSANTVIGQTDQVVGQVTVDPTDPSTARVGGILINARTFATDDTLRGRAIRNWILSTDQYEYVSFTPGALKGLPAEATPGASYELQIAGQLTIRDMTRDVTFDATVTPVSDGELRGRASATIRYADWNIGIPQVPFVASVSDSVRLELEFVADVG